MSHKDLKSKSKLKNFKSVRQTINRSHIRNSMSEASEHPVGLPGNISSSTFRHSSISFSFPKVARFKGVSLKGKESIYQSEIILPNTRNQRTTSMGYGQKKTFQFQFQEKNVLNVPSPDTYNVSVSLIKKSKCSFGLPWNIYSKTYIPNNKTQSIDVSARMPGPGNYNIQKPLGQNSLKYKLTSRGKMYNEMFQENNPAPNIYNPQHLLSESRRFHTVTQGIGNRNLFSKTNDNPGPGRYQILSKFDIKTQIDEKLHTNRMHKQNLWH